MNTQDWLGVILTTLSIVALVCGAIKWYIGTQVKPVIEAIEDIRSETKTNGGSSMRDEIRSIKKQQEIDCVIRQDQKNKLDHMYDILLEYISKNSK
jgi:hypothetical protein